MIMLTLNDIATCFFLDSGSTRSIIPYPVLKRRNLHHGIKPIEISVRGASGSKLNVIGCVTLYNQLFIVTKDHKTPGDILIGFDFMRRRNLILDAGKGIVMLGDKLYELQDGKSDRNITSQNLRIVWEEMNTEFSRVQEIVETLNRQKTQSQVKNDIVIHKTECQVKKRVKENRNPMTSRVNSRRDNIELTNDIVALSNKYAHLPEVSLDDMDSFVRSTHVCDIFTNVSQTIKHKVETNVEVNKNSVGDIVFNVNDDICTPYLEAIEEVVIPPFCKLRINTILRNRPVVSKQEENIEQIEEEESEEDEDDNEIGLVNVIDVEGKEAKPVHVEIVRPALAMLLPEYLMI